LTSKTSSAIGSPLLFSHGGQLLAMSFGEMIPRASLVARQSCRNLREQFRVRFLALLPQDRGEIRPGPAKQIGTRFFFLRRANLRSCFSVYRAALARTFWGVTGQWPGQPFVSKNPTLFGIRQLFMPGALLKEGWDKMLRLDEDAVLKEPRSEAFGCLTKVGAMKFAKKYKRRMMEGPHA
jgi:hypothetical protein